MKILEVSYFLLEKNVHPSMYPLKVSVILKFHQFLVPSGLLSISGIEKSCRPLKLSLPRRAADLLQ